MVVRKFWYHKIITSFDPYDKTSEACAPQLLSTCALSNWGYKCTTARLVLILYLFYSSIIMFWVSTYGGTCSTIVSNWHLASTTKYFFWLACKITILFWVKLLIIVWYSLWLINYKLIIKETQNIPKHRICKVTTVSLWYRNPRLNVTWYECISTDTRIKLGLWVSEVG